MLVNIFTYIHFYNMNSEGNEFKLIMYLNLRRDEDTVKIGN